MSDRVSSGGIYDGFYEYGGGGCGCCGGCLQNDLV